MRNQFLIILLNDNFDTCVVGLLLEAERLYDVRKNRLAHLNEKENLDYVNIDKNKKEVDNAKKTFKNINGQLLMSQENL